MALLRRIRPDVRDVAPSEYGQRAIVREAQAIFDLDVRPKLRENPKERVMALQRQGFTVAQIAARVSLKATEVQRLLNEDPSES
ncbi:hypothetical protein [Hyalangium rubrum]|uniref:Uncharacterized protein n=1 Tax=Hyalangium rubrum TaxID=3103134 RepID=A0ABU5H8H0_9BACT|nr:hypothetical protein [Hyalangium sp. s54d21]MDY7229153.1 hypothetical protein [Hyalangium sp. s54d21]